MPRAVTGQLCELLREPSGVGHGSLDEQVIACARRHDLHLVLAARLAVGALAGDLRAAAALDAARSVELRVVLQALAEAGLRPVLIKGASIAQTHYGRPELRPRLDTDVLIPYEGRREAARALSAIGYSRPVETDGDLTISQFHMQRTDAAGLFHALDLHWHIVNVRAFTHVLTHDEVARDGVPLPALGPHAFGPSAVHSLIIAAVHRIAHHGDSPHLLWLYDIHLLAAGLSPAERSALARLAASRGVLAVCRENLRRAADAFGGIPSELIDALQPPQDTVEPTAAFLGDPLRPVDILRADLTSLPRWSSRLQLLREHLFPSRTYMYERYGTRRPSSLPWLYLRRIVTGAPKWFRL